MKNGKNDNLRKIKIKFTRWLKNVEHIVNPIVLK
jgi:hypothetical protein